MASMQAMEPELRFSRKPRRKISRILGNSRTEPYPYRVLKEHHDPVSRPASAIPFILSFHNLTYSVKTHDQELIPACFSWHNASLPVDPKSRMKVLLDDISGEAREGEIMAILGASGSGKTTLIDALADRIARESLKGTIILNGYVLESKLLRTLSAYIVQDDLLFPMLTVEETLMFAAEFRLPWTMSKSRKKARVQDLIDQLGLRDTAKTVIGDEGQSGVSGGERRRVCIGTDIIHNPIVMFLDEPTSGLDSTSAYMVVKVLQRIAKSGSIVIMSVHQPSHRILSLFDRMIFLSLGQTVFSSSPGDLQEFFAEFGNPIPANEDKSEFALDCITELEGTPGGTKKLVDFNKTWQKNKTSTAQTSNWPQQSSLKDAISTSISKGKLVTGAPNMDPNLFLSSVPKFANPFWREMIVIANRSITNSRRTQQLYWLKFGGCLLLGFILSDMFWRLDNSPIGAQQRQGFFSLVMFITLFNCIEAVPVFLLERYIFMRETAYNAYRHSSYVLSHAIISIPFLTILSLAFTSMTFWSVGLAGGTSGFLYYFALVLASFWAASSFVMFASGITVDLIMSYMVASVMLCYFVLLSGFVITRDRMPRYWIWFHYASPAKYLFQGLMQNEFDDPSRCLMSGIQMFDSSPLLAAPDSLKLKLLDSMSKTLQKNITSSTCLTNGKDILHQRGLTDLNKWNCLWITIAWGVFFRILFYFVLLIGSKNKRR